MHPSGAGEKKFRIFLVKRVTQAPLSLINTSNQPDGQPTDVTELIRALEETTMNAPLRFNDALLIAGHAFEPFQCVAWAPQDGNGELSLTVIDRTSNRIGRKQIPSSTYSDKQQLASVLEQARAEISNEGYDLMPWTMPA
ncbi:Uncharacterized protein ABJ99_0757 [Pseudomonas syringae pv. cilantro]|uniref:Uncharacterized protein n=1 Tax=Pseudomonas syringae pv. cilantro TaxID=81035 RepID=A0A0N0XBG1_PSESX|nr:Uncharacterized protein ABJ99_0757 [Pseudomonas syringae pv. cilantro]KPW75125.1 Uncharacterized protein ALO76_02090 [Pseudomonas syringae pv. coriandricola]